MCLMSFQEAEGPSVIIIGMGSITIKNSSNLAHSRDQFSFNLTRLAQTAPLKISHNVRVLWVPIPPRKECKTSNDMNAPSRDPFTNEQIDLFNSAAVEILEHSGVEVWWSSRLLAQGRLDKSLADVYPGEDALAHDTQILLNAYCNDHMNFNDGTCCWSAEPYTSVQVVTYAFFAVW